MNSLTWKSTEATDFIEAMTSLICSDVHHHLSIVQMNSLEINNIITSWSNNQQLGVFSIRNPNLSYSIEEVQQLHRYRYSVPYIYNYIRRIYDVYDVVNEFQQRNNDIY